MNRKMLKWFIMGVVLFMGTELSAQSARGASAGKPPVNHQPAKNYYNAKQTRENAVLLLESVQKNQNNPAFDMKAAQKQLLNSPFVSKGLYELDQTYPLYVLTGNKQQDAAEMKRLKMEWINNNPQRYQAILNQQSKK
ncbi:MAG: hypothetical protein K1X92_01565 [Bacteroidia bacterium]|nr:hypothetical protein [Bacteroidia bacterium]